MKCKTVHIFTYKNLAYTSVHEYKYSHSLVYQSIAFGFNASFKVLNQSFSPFTEVAEFARKIASAVIKAY